MQLTIDFAVDRAYTLDNYYSQNNEDLVVHLQQFVTQKTQRASDSLFYLYAPEGNGKSHLIQAVCQYAYDNGVSCQYIPVEAFRHYETYATLGMENFDVLFVDDVDLLYLQPEWQQAMFDLINRVLEAGNKLIFSARNKPSDSQFSLKDLESRLEWGQIWRLQPLGDEQQISMMQFRAKCKGIELNEEVAHFIHMRLSREPNVIMRCLEKLDKSSLQAQRKLTIPFVKEVMGW